jgi:RHS repeat-associated protein
MKVKRPASDGINIAMRRNRFPLYFKGGRQFHPAATMVSCFRISTFLPKWFCFYWLISILRWGDKSGFPNVAATRLASVTGTPLAASFVYDWAGQRFSKTNPGSAPILYSYMQGGTLIAENDSGTVSDYVYPDGRPIAVLQPQATTATNQVNYVHADRLGTPQIITNSSESNVWNTTYQPFGTTGLLNAAINQNLRFPGQNFDAETGFNYNLNRDYVPYLGRYLESDPIGLDGGINTYQYVSGNPARYIDPIGLQRYPDAEPGAPYSPADYRGTPLGFPQNVNQRYDEAKELADYLNDTTELQKDLIELRTLFHELAEGQRQAQELADQTFMLQQISSAPICTRQNPQGRQEAPNPRMFCGPNGCGDSIRQEYESIYPLDSPDVLLQGLFPMPQSQ